jgi:hypothetical protein
MPEMANISATVYRCKRCGETLVLGSAEWRTREPFELVTLRNVTSEYESHSFEPGVDIVWMTDPPPAYRGLSGTNSDSVFIPWVGGADKPEARVVPGVYGEFTHDGMKTARFILTDREQSSDLSPQGDVSDAWSVCITWNGTGPITTETYPRGWVERRRYAVVSMWASLKGEVLVDITGQSGSVKACV